jgi:hypothetical protein
MKDNSDIEKHLDWLRKDLTAWENGLRESQGELFFAQLKLQKLERDESWEGPTSGYPESHAKLADRVQWLNYEISKLKGKIEHRQGAIQRTLSVMRRSAAV